MDAGGRAAPAPGGLAAFTTSLWIVTQEAKTEGLGERELAHWPSPQPSPVNGRGSQSDPCLLYTLCGNLQKS